MIFFLIWLLALQQINALTVNDKNYAISPLIKIILNMIGEENRELLMMLDNPGK